MQRPRRDVVATAAPLARGRAGSRRFFRESADNVRLDPQGKLAYVGYGDGALAVIHPQQMKKIGDVKLDGHPEAFQLEQNGPRIFINVPTAHQVAVVDRERMTVIAKWDVKAAASNSPMALHGRNRRLFIGCRNPATLVALDIDAGKSVASMDCCGETDDLFYDPHVKRLYITGGAERGEFQGSRRLLPIRRTISCGSSARSAMNSSSISPVKRSARGAPPR